MKKLDGTEMGGESFAGVITLVNWTLMPNGQTYLYLWARKWVVMTDDVIGRFINAPKFRSSERWSLVGYGDGPDPKVFIPGCQVKGWARCEEVPPHASHAGAYEVT